MGHWIITLFMQAWGPEFEDPEPTAWLSTVGAEDPKSSLASQPSRY